VKILIVEDSNHLRNYLSKALKREGHTVDISEDGAQGLWHAESFRYDVMILDVMLPEMNGFEVLAKLRESQNQTHILLLTARDSKQDVLHGLKSGADDYMVKPFDLDELVARVEALGRRAQKNKSPLVSVGPLTLDTLAKKISIEGVNLDLPHRELTILGHLMVHSEEVISRQALEEQIYDVNKNVMSNSVNSAISVIRKQLSNHNCADLLETRRGLGYILSSH